MSSGKEVSKWADDFMFEAEEIDPADGPEVWLLSCNPDPLGSIAAAAKAYKGEFVESLAEITDQERRYYLGEIQKTALAMPLEAVQFHFRVSGVTRGFTHQMVRQRTAAYSQESTRFAVKSGVPVGLPPSLDGTHKLGGFEELRQEYVDRIGDDTHEADQWAFKYMSDKDKWRYKWDNAVANLAEVYNELVNDGMPAEDARGLLPTNLLTQINYITNLRNFHAEAGKRLCTQAQFEWRLVWYKFVEAIREFGKTQTYLCPDPDDTNASIQIGPLKKSSAWQFEELAKLFKPVCYTEGSCKFLAEFDRKCTIRDRVQANAAINRPSSEWSSVADLGMPQHRIDANSHLFKWSDRTTDHNIIPAIYPEEWLLNPKAAR